MTTIVYDQIQLRRGTAAVWTAANPILAQGEIGYETDTNLFKIGDGVTYWNAMGYSIGGAKTLAQLNAILSGSGAVALTANATLVAGTEYYCTTTSTALTLTMPIAANLGDTITVYDATNNAAVNNITILPNGLAINGSVQSAVMNINAGRMVFKYTGTTYGWRASS